MQKLVITVERVAGEMVRLRAEAEVAEGLSPDPDEAVLLINPPEPFDQWREHEAMTIFMRSLEITLEALIDTVVEED